MTEQRDEANQAAREQSGAAAPGRDNQENELEAEQESAAAMDADVPQPPGADETTEGQPS